MKKLPPQPLNSRYLEIEEIRLVGDLRIMHSKVDELYHLVRNLKKRYSEAAVQKYADEVVLNEDIELVDSIYLWFVSLKEQARKQASGGRRR